MDEAVSSLSRVYRCCTIDHRFAEWLDELEHTISCARASAHAGDWQVETSGCDCRMDTAYGADEYSD